MKNKKEFFTCILSEPEAKALDKPVDQAYEPSLLTKGSFTIMMAVIRGVMAKGEQCVVLIEYPP